MKGSQIKRYSDSLKGMVSLASSTLLGKPLIWGMPFSAGIELTNCCNLACPECASGSGLMKRERGFMSHALFEKIIEEKDSALLHASLYFQGEPMMHPEFFSFLEKGSRLHLTVSTNGHFLTRENSYKLAASPLNKLIVSLDGMDQETYTQYRKNGDLKKVIEGIRNISEAIRTTRSKLKLEIQFLVNSRNESQISEVRKFALETGAGLSLKSMQIINEGKRQFWLPVNEKFSRYYYSDGNYRIKSDLKNRCSRLWFNPVITWDGLVVPCCFDKDAEYVMGDINVNSLREIWYGEKYMEFRSRLLSERSSIGICRNCTSGLKV